MSDTIYTIEKIKDIVKPIANKYNVQSIYLFGSYARGDANENSDLDFLVFGGNNFKLTNIFALAEERGEKPFIIICDELEDPHNLGAVIRTAEATGAHGVIIPKRRNASLSYVVGKASAGAVEYVPVARVSNIAQTIDELKERGIWFYAADMDGEDWCSVNYDGGVGLVIGSEGRGISRLVKEKCDFIVSMPMKGKINSLNASVAAGVLMYEVARQRAGIKAKG